VYDCFNLCSQYGFTILKRDFNCVLDPQLDRSSNRPISLSQMAKAINQAKSDFALCDIWRLLYPTKQQFSYYSYVHDMFSRIDLVLLSNSLVHRVVQPEYLSKSISDHSPLRMTLASLDRPTSPCIWRFDQLLLNKPEFVLKIKRAISEFLEFNETSFSLPQILWAVLKAYLWGVVIAYSVSLNRDARLKETELEIRAQEAETAHYKTCSSETHRKWMLVRSELNKYTIDKAERALARTQAIYCAQGDCSGKLLAWQLRREAAECLIPDIRNKSGQLVTDPKLINETFVEFYNLYTSQYPTDMTIQDNFLDGIDIPSLSEETRASLEALISVEEISHSLMSMKAGKS
uniref:Endonuclease/exonuclease/phosphatase domain-containing protein n=1 Tax=Latimeria chalumnae TaxID=7897 RepID=H2ZY03_LATCH